jgi:hypothetical protein
MRTAIAVAILLAACSAPEQELVTKVYDFDDAPIEGDLVKPTPVALIEGTEGMSQNAALLEKADAFFDENNMHNAQLLYEAVAQSQDPILAPYARYKLAWVHYNLGEFKEALVFFVALAQTRDADGQPTALAGQALSDTVLVFAEVGTPTQAPAFYEKLAGDAWRTYCDRLVSLYDAQGKLDALKILSDLLD